MKRDTQDDQEKTPSYRAGEDSQIRGDGQDDTNRMNRIGMMSKMAKLSTGQDATVTPAIIIGPIMAHLAYPGYLVRSVPHPVHPASSCASCFVVVAP